MPPPPVTLLVDFDDEFVFEFGDERDGVLDFGRKGLDGAVDGFEDGGGVEFVLANSSDDIADAVRAVLGLLNFRVHLVILDFDALTEALFDFVALGEEGLFEFLLRLLVCDVLGDEKFAADGLVHIVLLFPRLDGIPVSLAETPKV